MFLSKVKKLLSLIHGLPTILNDSEIERLAQEEGMIVPYTAGQVRMVNDLKVMSYGTSSYGFDLRLNPKDFRIFKHIPGTIVNPKQFNSDNVVKTELHKDEYGQYFILPAHSYGLGVSLERLKMPPDVTGNCTGKSSYARCGTLVGVTPLEAGWEGYLTIEISNSSAADCRIYANEGICQILFFRGYPCSVSYAARKGKYQGQEHEVVLARI